jgi:hypothetical protein
MKVVELDHVEYKNIFPTNFNVFISPDFCYLNKDKADVVYYLAFNDGKFRLGMIVGIRENVVLSPYSAPFGGFSYVKNDIKINQLEDAVDALECWAKKKSFFALKIILPPEIYNTNFISKQLNVFFRKEFKFLQVDLNYSIRVDLINDNYQNLIWRNARKNLNIGLKSRLSFEKCVNLEDCERAYNVIVKNRNSRGFPLRMSWEQVLATIKFIGADFFLCKDDLSNNIASAMVFMAAEDIAQVIYWGDLPEYSEKKTMNYLSYQVFEYYKNMNFRIIDIGPSTESSLPNYGLSEFKESIGCSIQPKYSLYKELL